MKEKILILTADSNGGYPVPPVNGGAVSTLVGHMVEDNQTSHLCNLSVLSFFDERAQAEAKAYSRTSFSWVGRGLLIRILDCIVFNLVRIIFPRKKSISFKSVFSLLKYVLVARHLLKKEKFDRILIENNMGLAWALSTKGPNATTPYYFHLHNVPRTSMHRGEIISNASGFFAVSQFVADQIESSSNSIGPIPSSKISVLKNCIDIQRFNINATPSNLSAIRSQYHISPSQHVIIYTGRLSSEKGIEEVIRAVASSNTKPSSKLLILGGELHGSSNVSTYQVHLEKLCQDLEVNAVFCGYIPQNTIPTYYKLGDVAVLPSMWEEPAGLTMVEAIACGIPVITTTSGGIPEYVGQIAEIFDRDEKLVENIANELDRLLNNASLIKERSVIGYKFVKEHYNSAGYMSRTLSLMKGIAYE